MKDFLGHELHIGDIVVFTGRVDSSFRQGPIVKFEDDLVVISFVDSFCIKRKSYEVIYIQPSKEESKEIDMDPYSIEMNIMDEYYEDDLKNPEHLYSQVYDYKKDRVILNVEIMTGKILNLKKVFKPFELFLKVVDEGIYTIKNRKGEVIFEVDGYVPNHWIPEKDGYGDYVTLKINKEGIITNWYKGNYLKKEIQKSINSYKENLKS